MAEPAKNTYAKLLRDILEAFGLDLKWLKEDVKKKNEELLNNKNA